MLKQESVQDDPHVAHPVEKRRKQRKFRISAQETFAALRHRNYRLWFIGQLVSLVGTWMQTTAQAYLLYQLTNSPLYLGLVGFASGAPSWLFMLYGGLVADRMSRRTLLIITQTTMMLLAFILAGLAFLGLVQPWHIIVLAFLLGTANAFDAPARQSFVLEMVSREDLTNAIALNSTMFNSATAVGPAVAGGIYAWLGPAWCFTFNGVSFIAVIVALAMMRIAPVPRVVRSNSAWEDIRSGIHFVISDRVVRTIIINLGVISLFGMSFATLIPAWAVDVLHGDAATNGFLQSARGVGALLGALMIAVLGSYSLRGRLWTTGSFIFPGMLFVLTITHSLPLSLLALLAVGWGVMIVFNTSNSLVQTRVPDELRGRVMGIYTLVFFGSAPIGAVLAGEAAALLGEAPAVLIGGIFVLISSIIIFWRLPELRAIG